MNQAEAWIKAANVACNKQLQKLQNIIEEKVEDQEDHIKQKRESWKMQLHKWNLPFSMIYDECLIMT